MTLRLGVLISGRGSNLQAILDAIRSNALDAEVRLVVSNRPSAPGLARAEQAGVPARVVQHGQFETRAAFDAELARQMRASGVEWVVLAGFMRVLGQAFLGEFPERVINVHPSLLPAFPGVRAQAQAVEYGVRVTGCTVHFVDAGTDTGPIIAQRHLEIEPMESVESVEARLLKEEHFALVSSLQLISTGQLALTTTAAGRRRVVLR